MAKKEELIATAESLGLPTKGLTVAELEKAIADKQAAGVVDEQVDTKPVEKEISDKQDEGINDEQVDTNTNAILFDTETVKETIEKAIELGIKTKGVSFEEVVSAIVIKEGEIEAIKEQKVAEEKAAEKALKDAFKYNGKFYGLSDRCPKTLKVLDVVYKQKELLKNKDAMEFLIVGNSVFIKRLK